MSGVIAGNYAQYTDMKECKATDGGVIKILHQRRVADSGNGGGRSK